ncbi:MAG: hypothetical protein GY719_04780 [bacterium]|nr:hypothetical protein [bacterium]
MNGARQSVLGLLLAAAVAAPGLAQTVTIDFDGLPAGTVVDVQFPEAGFGAGPGIEVQAAAVGFAPSPPNIICTVPVAGGATCVSDLQIVFIDPVDDLTFHAFGAKTAGVVAQARVFTDGVPIAVVDVVSPGGGLTPVLVDLSAFTAVTEIEIFGVTDPAGVGWDDFTFSISPLPIFADGFESGDTAAWTTPPPPMAGDLFGHLFEDTDGNGVQDSGEPDLAGIDVEITDVNAVAQTVTTNATGDYVATVPEGNTTADVDEATLPAGLIQTAGNDPTVLFVAAAGNVDFGTDGYQPRADVFGHLFEDTDGDGVQGMGEPDLAGVDVVITDSLGGMQTVGSNGTGDYAATMIPAGNTTADVDEATLPAGFVQTAGTDPTMVVAPAGSTTDLGDDGYQPQAMVFGRVFDDNIVLGGGQDPGEPGLMGVTVIITDSLGGMQPVITNIDGDYFATVPAGLTTADVDEATLPPAGVQTEGTDPTMVFVPAGSNTDMGLDGYNFGM